MGASLSCSSKGALLVVACANGDFACVQELLKKQPSAAFYHNFKDRTSPLIQASARGHFDTVQLVLETAVMHGGPEKARRFCIDHTNCKKQSALMVACKHGHPDCVEYLVTNGADPLICDERRHNTCLHFAALYGHSDCVNKLLASRVSFRVEQGRPASVSNINCQDEDGTPNTRFVDRHNGWGLTALHIAVFQGSVHTVRALLRHGATLESRIVSSNIDNCPIRCAIGSTALHVAALIGNISIAKVLLEAQESVPGLELRSRTDTSGLRPRDYALRSRNPVLVHLLDERLPVALLRQIWVNYSLEQAMPPRHQTLGAMLQKLKLMLNLETIALHHKQAADSAADEGVANPVNANAHVFGEGGKVQAGSLNAIRAAAARGAYGTGRLLGASQPLLDEAALWAKRLEQVQVLLSTVIQLHALLLKICQNAEWSPGNTSSTSEEAVLDFILSTLITPRTVSSILHAAKKLVCCNVMAMGTMGGRGGALGAGGAAPLPPDVEVQHGIALITTALRAVDTCLQAALHLTHPNTLAAAASAHPDTVATDSNGYAGGAMVALLLQQNISNMTTSSVESSIVGETFPASLNRSELAQTRYSSHSSVNTATTAPTVGTVDTTLATAGTVNAPSLGRASPSLSEAPSEPDRMVSSAPRIVVPAAQDAASLIVQQQQQQQAPVATTVASAAEVAAMGINPSGLPPGLAAAMGQPVGVSLFNSHWSAHLHSLIAQLHWDIGVQRHRRRRQHAATQAARSAAAAAAAHQRSPAADVYAGSQGLATNMAAMQQHLDSSGGGGVAAAVGPMDAGDVARQQRYNSLMDVANRAMMMASVTAAAQNASAAPACDEGGTLSPPAPVITSAAAAALTVSSIQYRRGDAPQDVLGEAMGAATLPPLDPLGRAGDIISVPPRLTEAQSDEHITVMISSPPWTLQPMAEAHHQHHHHQRPFLHMQQASNALTAEVFPRSSGVATLAAAAAAAASSSSAASRPLSNKEVVSAPTDQSSNAATTTNTGLETDDEDEEVGSVAWSEDDGLVCNICMDEPVAVFVTGCQHGLCVQCAFQLTIKGRDLPCCPFCRQRIPSFEPMPASLSHPPAQQSTGGSDGGGKVTRSRTAPPIRRDGSDAS